LTRKQNDDEATQLCQRRVRHEEEAHATREVSRRDGTHRAVGAADRGDRTAVPKSGRVGRPPIGVPKMLRMYCLQQWYGLADEALEDALYDS
jgi:hypothetical protein